MEHANAQGVRGRLKDSNQRNSAGTAHQPRPDSPLLALKGTSQRLAQHALPRFLGSETVLRRAIPVLIVMLLCVVGGVRAGSLLEESQRLEQSASNLTRLLADHVALQFENNEAASNALASPSLAASYLEEVAKKIHLHPGQNLYVASGNSRIIAAQPANDQLLGTTLSRLLGVEGADFVRAGETPVFDVKFDGNLDSIATSRIVGEDASGPVHLIVTQTNKSIYAPWYQHLNQGIVLLVAIGSVLMVILYLYFVQGARIRETEILFSETNARFDTALARGYCGLWDWDLSRGHIVWSRSMYEMLGMTHSGKAMGFGELARLLHPDDPDMLSLANSVFQVNQGQIDHRFRIMHASGTWVWMRIRAELVQYKGTDPHLIGIAVDISEQEALKQQTRDADVRLRDAIENISEAFVLWDSKKKLVMCNSKYQQLYDLPANAVTSGTSHRDVMSNGRKPRISKPVPSERNGDTNAQIFEAQIDDGRWLQISERRTRDGGFVSVGTDITQIKRNHEKLVESERKQMATIADLRKTQQELEKQAQKLVEFADNLNEEKKRADAGNRTKSEFLANISHELRTPLNAIIGFSDIMRTNMFGPLGSDKYHEYAKDIHDSGSFLLGVINDILDMSKIEAGRFQLDPEKLNLHELLDETLRIIKIQAEEAELTVTENISKSLELDADRRAVKQILINLLSNAVKFTGKGGKIKVSAKGMDNSVNIKIRDNGIGISAIALEKLTQPFEQVQDQFTKNHKGSGLGLAIARSLALLHGGDLTIESKVDEGTTVTVKLPYKCKSAVKTDTETKQKSTEPA